MSISFVVPTLNEAGNVSKIFNIINDALLEEQCDWEVIFVDDKSTDTTQSEIRGLNHSAVNLLVSPARRGLGAALSQGWHFSKCEFVVFLDCDSSVSATDLSALISMRKSNQVIIGSRYMKDSVINGAPKLKVLLSKILNKLAGFLLQIRVSDLSHSLRIFPNAYVEIDEVLTHPGYFWIQSGKFKNIGYSFREVAITFNEREIGITKNNTVNMVKSVLDALHKIIILKFRRII